MSIYTEFTSHTHTHIYIYIYIRYIYLPKKGYAKDLIKNCLYKNIKRTIKINERFDF